MIVDLFAGPGGWSEGLRMLGLADVGIELDAAACATRAAAGHLTIRADVERYPAERFAGIEGLIASPPCQDFSLAGKQVGRTGEKGRLIDLVPEWVEATWPEWIACEQVPPCLPIWQEHARWYRSHGYSTWCGILNSADYGVPQTRKRAILIASAVGPAIPPPATHAKRPEVGLFGTQKPWVTMAEALGWGEGDRIRPARGEGMIERHGDRPDHPAAEPAPTVISKARSWTRFVSAGVTGEGRPKDPHSQPADTLTGKGTAYWCYSRPATTVVGSFRPDIISAPGYRTEVSRQDAEGGVRVTVAEGGVLQSFPADYPWQGSRSKQYQQVGNAVPPLLAAHVVGALTGRHLAERAA